MPFEGEHAARQESPGGFVESSFRRYIDTTPAGVSLIMAKKPGKDQLVVQSVRFDAAQWTAAAARKWLMENDYSAADFEQAEVVSKRWSVQVPISKTTDKCLAFGWASVIADEYGSVIVDHQGDKISIEELEQAAYGYVNESRQSTEMHMKKGVAELVESCVLTPEKREALGLPGGVTGWWVGFRVTDPSVWEKVKNGTYSEFSIGGTATRGDASVD